MAKFPQVKPVLSYSVWIISVNLSLRRFFKKILISYFHYYSFLCFFFMQRWQCSQHVQIILSWQEVLPVFDNVMKSEMASNYI